MMRMQLMVVVVHSKLSHRVVEGVYKMLGSDGEGRAEEIFTKMDKSQSQLDSQPQIQSQLQ